MDPDRSTLPQTVLANAEGAAGEPAPPRLMVRLLKALRGHHDSLRTGLPDDPVLAIMTAQAGSQQRKASAGSRRRCLCRERQATGLIGRNAYTTHKNVYARSMACMSNLHAMCIEHDLYVYTHRARCLYA